MATSREARTGSAGSVYVLATLRIHDRARYQRYVRRFHDVLVRYGGRLLAADESPEVLEGAWDRDKVILLSFESDASFRAWAGSEAYQEIARDRVASTEGSVLLVHGVPGQLALRTPS